MQRNTVAYDENQSPDLEKAVVLQDAISDLPPVCFASHILFDMFATLFQFISIHIFI